MAAIDTIEFVRDEISSHFRQYVEEADIQAILPRLPEETWGHLRRVRFRDGADAGGRLGDVVTGPEPEIVLHAQAYRVSLAPYVGRGETPETYGAVGGCRWPVLAIRRFLLYNVLLSQLGRLQRGEAGTNDRTFAEHWRGELWSRQSDDFDPVHHAPTEKESRLLRVGWAAADAEYGTGLELDDAGERTSAFRHYRRAIDHYPEHALALQGLGKLTYAGFGEARENEKLERAADWLRRALEVDPGLPDASLYLAIVLSRLARREKERGVLDRTVVPDPCETVSLATYVENLSKRGYREEAEALFEKVLKKVTRKDSRRDLALRAYARMLLYRSKEPDENDTRKAVDLLRQAVKLNPTDATNHLYLGLAYSWLDGHDAEALGEVREALSLRPDYEAASELLVELQARAAE